MDIYITFYSIEESSIVDCTGNKTFENNMLMINNGFSFGRDKKESDIDLFFNIFDENVTVNIEQSINKYKPNKIWASITFYSELQSIINIIDERWIIGGPHIFNNKDNLKFKEQFLKSKLIYTTMEEYLGKEISSDFDPYFIEFAKQFPNYDISYNISLGLYPCYWGKCKFCTFKNVSMQYKRKNIDKIINGSVLNNKFIGFINLSSTSPNVLKKIVNANNKHNIIELFMRADEQILKQIKQFDDLQSYVFTIGAEGLAQGIIDELNKGYKISVLFELIEEILKRNGKVRLSMMCNYAFLTRDIVDEFNNNIKIIEEIYKKYATMDNQLKLYGYTNPVFWPDKTHAEEEGFSSVSLRNFVNIPSYSNDSYATIIPKNDIQHMFNKEIYKCICNSTIPKEHMTFINKRLINK